MRRKVSAIQTVDTKRWSEGTLVSLMIASLKGISQVFLIENAVTGFVILLAITFVHPPLGMITILSAVLGTWIARIAGGDESAIKQGLFGYNPVLTGLALSLLLSGGNRWGIALAGACISACVTAAMMHVLRNSALPVLTFP